MSGTYGLPPPLHLPLSTSDKNNNNIKKPTKWGQSAKPECHFPHKCVRHWTKSPALMSKVIRDNLCRYECWGPGAWIQVALQCSKFHEVFIETEPKNVISEGTLQIYCWEHQVGGGYSQVGKPRSGLRCLSLWVGGSWGAACIVHKSACLSRGC